MSKAKSDSPSDEKDTRTEPKRSSLWLRFLKLFSDMITPTNIGILVGLLIIGATFFFGGLKPAEAHQESLPALTIGESAEVGPFKITVEEGFWTNDVAPIIAGWTESTFLVVKAQADNTNDSWVQTGILQDSITARLPSGDLEPQSGLWSNSNASDGTLGFPSVYRGLDFQASRTLQPHMPQTFWFVWQLPPDTERTESVQLEFYSHTWRRSSLDGGYYWADRALAVTQDLTVQDPGQVK